MNWESILKTSGYAECEICARDRPTYDMLDVNMKNPKMQEWLKSQRLLNVPDSKNTVRLCKECVDELQPQLDKKKEAGDFE